jgi:hypothetical protein
MLNKIHEGLELAYESVVNKKPMTVGTVKPGDLEGKTKEKGPKKSGADCTDAKKAEEAPAELQGDTVKDSQKKGKGMSKFDELYSKAIKEDVAPSIEDQSFDTDAQDFPPAGEEEAAAELGDEGDMEGSEGDAFSELADLFSKASELFAKMAGSHGAEAEGEGEMISDEPSLDDDEALPQEAVEMEKAPDSVNKMTSKGNMNVGAVKVTKQTASNKASGAKNGGQPEVAKDTNLNPKMKFKANGSGPIVDGKNVNMFG